MKTPNGHLTHVMLAIGALFLAMTAAMRGVNTPVLSTITAAEDGLRAGVVVDDGVPF